MPLPAEPTIVKSGTVVLEYPHDTPTLTVTLRSPNYQDAQSINVTRIFRETRGKKRISYRDSLWPITESLRYIISNIDATTKDDFESLLVQSLGKRIKLTDFESLEWVGIITNPDSAIATVRGDDCSYQIELEFEGERV